MCSAWHVCVPVYVTMEGMCAVLTCSSGCCASLAAARGCSRRRLSGGSDGQHEQAVLAVCVAQQQQRVYAVAV